MSAMTALILACGLVLSGCGTAPQRTAAEARQTTQKAVQKIDRICALPRGEREAQLEKLEAESGIVLFCGK
jgi:starvation-inducible outer membrane lipoprotein